MSKCECVVAVQGGLSLLGGVLGFGSDFELWYNLCFIVNGAIALFIGWNATQNGKFNKCLATLLGIFGTGMFVIAVLIGMLVAFVSGVCDAVDDAVETGDCTGTQTSGGGSCTAMNNQQAWCKLNAGCTWTATSEESDVCGINPLTYICAILDIVSALMCLVFGYAVCCCTKDKGAQVAATAAPQVVIVQQAPVEAAVVAVVEPAKLG